MRKKVLWLTFWVTMVFWFGQGCASIPSYELNESNHIIGGEPIPALSDLEPVQFAGGVSVTGMDRSDWATMSVEVSRNDVASRHVYWQAVTLRPDDGPRQTGEYPTTESIHDLADTVPAIQSQVLEIFIEPGRVVWDMVMLPYKLVTTHRWRTRQYGPIHDYELVPGESDGVIVYPEGE